MARMSSEGLRLDGASSYSIEYRVMAFGWLRFSVFRDVGFQVCATELLVMKSGVGT